MARILFVNQSTGTLFIDILNAFAEAGHEVTLFSGRVKKGNRPLNKNIKTIRGMSYIRKNLVLRFFTWLGFSIVYAVVLIWYKKPDIIFVVTNPPIAPLVTWLIAGIRRIPYFVLVYDLYPEALVISGIFRENNAVCRIWKKVNVKVFKGAWKVFTLSQSMRDSISAYIDIGKIQVIHNWSDGNYIRPVARDENPFIRSHGINGKKIVLYSGNMGLTHDLESVIEAARMLDHVSDLQFIMVGEGGKKGALIEMARRYNLPNVLFLPYQDADNFPYAIAAADIGVVTLDAGAEGIAVPSKTYTNMAAGLCLLVIAPKASEISRMVA